MLSGGRLFDVGMYGCIFTPPLECKDKTKKVLEENDFPSLSKLILKDAANLEFSISQLIRQIPLWKNYFVVSESICTPAPVQKEKELAECPVVQDYKLSDFRILTMSYGGTPMNIYRFDLSKFDFLNFVIHFIEAGALLALFGIINRDIHQGNILIDTHDVPRIIDFNLAIPVKSNITTNKLKHKYDFSTGQEPPDSTLVNAIMMGFPAERVIDSVLYKKPILKKIRSLLNISATQQLQSLETFYNMSKSVKSGDSVKWFNTYWRTIDSWAFGANLVDLISKLSLWPDFAQNLKKVSPKLFPVLRRLCAVSPLERIDCVQALNYLAPNSFIIRRYGKSWLAKVGDGNIV